MRRAGGGWFLRGIVLALVSLTLTVLIFEFAFRSLGVYVGTHYIGRRTDRSAPLLRSLRKSA